MSGGHALFVGWFWIAISFCGAVAVAQKQCGIDPYSVSAITRSLVVGYGWPVSMPLMVVGRIHACPDEISPTQDKRR